MTLDASVVLSALFFTIIAIVLASAFLAKKPAPKKEQKEKEHEERSERVTEYHQPIVEQPAPEPKEVIIEKKREEPVPVAPVVEAEVIPVPHTPVQVSVLAIQCTLRFLDTSFELIMSRTGVLASRHEMSAAFVRRSVKFLNISAF